MAVSEERMCVGSSFLSHIQCFSSQVLHSRDQEALGDTAGKRLLRGRPAGKALLPLTWAVTGRAEVGAHDLCHMRGETGICVAKSDAFIVKGQRGAVRT